MTDPKTLSNLPLDVSIRWAEDQLRLEESRPIIRDSQLASSHAQADTVLFSKYPELVALLDLFKRNPSWASFQMPPNFMQSFRRIFRLKLTGFIGTEDQQEAVMSRLLNAEKEEEGPSWEEDKKTLIQLLNLLNKLNKDLIDITARCKQYQKG